MHDIRPSISVVLWLCDCRVESCLCRTSDAAAKGRRVCTIRSCFCIFLEIDTGIVQLVCGRIDSCINRQHCVWLTFLQLYFFVIVISIISLEGEGEQCD